MMPSPTHKIKKCWQQEGKENIPHIQKMQLKRNIWAEKVDFQIHITPGMLMVCH